MGHPSPDPGSLAARVRASMPRIGARIAAFLERIDPVRRAAPGASDSPADAHAGARPPGADAAPTTSEPGASSDATGEEAWSEAVLHGILHHTNAIVHVRDTEGRFLLVNGRFEEAFGVRREEAIGRTPSEVLPAGLATAIEADEARAMKDGRASQVEELDAAHAEVRTYVAVKLPLLDASGVAYAVCSVATDVTEQRHAETRRRRRTEALLELWRTNLARARDLDESLRRITRHASRALGVERVGVWLFEPDRTRIRCLCLYEATPDRHTSGAVLSADEHPAYFRALAADRAVAADAARDDARTAELADGYLAPIGITSMMDAAIRMDGETVGVLCHEHVGPARHWTEEARVFAGSLADLTAYAIHADARARAERAREEADRRHEAILSCLGDAIVAIGPDGRVRFVNPAAIALLRLSPDGAVGRDAREVVVPCDARGEPEEPGLDALLRDDDGPRGETHVRRADGVAIPVLARATRIDEPEAEADRTVSGETGAGGPVPPRVGHVLVLRDLTESRRIEEGVRRAERMQAVGALAGGIAHDVNNLLTVVHGTTQVLLERTPASDPSRELVEEIRRAGERSGALVRRLLSIARGDRLRPVSADVSAVVADLEPLLARLVGPSVRVVLDLASHVPPVRVDVSALEQVVVNLAANARDAMPTGGLLTIRTRESASTLRGPCVALSVEDSGTGIPTDVRPRIFDPFFTTKEPEKGTGLGLSIVHGIVTGSGGWIDVESARGRGSVFRVELPVEARAEGAHPDAVARGPTADAAVVLLAEDDDLVRRLACRALSRAGFRVLETKDGLEALAAAEGRAGPIDLLVTDVSMPRMEGPELVRRLLVRRPGIRTILMTGYGAEGVRDALPRAPAITILEKPFTPDRLIDAARALLALPSAPPAPPPG